MQQHLSQIKQNAYKIPVFAAEDGQMEAGLLASDSISMKAW